MSIRNYNAWIKAARKASAKTGGLSLPAARKSYQKMAARVGRPLKGTDVKKHPRIFKESIPAKSGGKARGFFSGKVKGGAPARGAEAAKGKDVGPISTGEKRDKGRGKGIVGREQGKAQPARKARELVIDSFDDYADAWDFFELDDIEYVSTADYGKSEK